MEKSTMERTDDMSSDVKKVIIIMRGLRAGLLSVDEVLQMLLYDGRKDPLYDAGLTAVNRFIMGKTTDEQKRLFMDYRDTGGTQEDAQAAADQIDGEDVYADIHDLIMDADEEPDWPSY